MTERWNVLIPEHVDESGPEEISDFADVTYPDEYDSREEILDDIDRYHAIVVRTFVVDEELLERASNLEVVSKHGVGLDNVDIEAASEHDVVVCNLPGINPQEVAEHTLTLLLALRKKVVPADEGVKAGEWPRNAFDSRTVKGDTLGLFGLGDIGRRTARLARGVGMECVTYDPYVTQADLSLHVHQAETKAELFDRADCISVHTPLTEETRGAIGADELARLPDTAVLVNTARGGIVDEDALLDALEAGELDGAGLDVFADEPPAADHPLLDRDDVVLTPHMAGVTVESLRRMSIGAAENIRTVYNGRVPQSTVNADDISL